ncbi:MAG: PrpR N-terminal domain-containing protein, partial [Clostridiales bacterium]|nr:PrpR N-terminal domain-containing protein [Clostridiales bacterium]
MKRSVTRILGIAPYEGLRIAMIKAVREYPQIRMDVYTGDLINGVEIVHNLESEEYDIIISRGGTAEMIAKTTQIPVISIQISVYDVLRAIKMAENYSRRYAIVGFASVTKAAYTLCDLLQYHLDIITIQAENEIPDIMKQLKESGYHMIISDVISHTTAREMGLDAFLITSGTESIQQAFNRALSVSDDFYALRHENLLLRAACQDEEVKTVIMDEEGNVHYAKQTRPENSSNSFRQWCIPEIASR